MHDAAVVAPPLVVAVTVPLVATSALMASCRRSGFRSGWSGVILLVPAETLATPLPLSSGYTLAITETAVFVSADRAGASTLLPPVVVASVTPATLLAEVTCVVALPVKSSPLTGWSCRKSWLRCC